MLASSNRRRRSPMKAERLKRRKKRSWAELHPELLHLITKKLENFSNFIRFRSVCKQWRAAACPVDAPPQLPWLLQPATLNCASKVYMRTDYIVYSLSTKSTSQVELPIPYKSYRHYCFKEPSIGYLLIDNDHILKPPYLFNPLTKKTIHLPFPKPQLYYPIYMGPNNKSNSSTVKDGVHLVVYTVKNGDTDICSWQSDNNELTTFKIPSVSWVFGCYKEKLFAYERFEQNTRVFDMSTGAELNIKIPLPTKCLCFDFFVEAMGDLLAVAYPSPYPYWFNRNLRVYRLEHSEDFSQCRWIELTGIGDRILFLGSADAGFCLDASNFEGLRGNCIYYVRYHKDTCENCGSDRQYNRLSRYDMENGTTEVLMNNIAKSATWFMPSLI